MYIAGRTENKFNGKGGCVNVDFASCDFVKDCDVLKATKVGRDLGVMACILTYFIQGANKVPVFPSKTCFT